MKKAFIANITTVIVSVVYLVLWFIWLISKKGCITYDDIVIPSFICVSLVFSTHYVMLRA